MNQKDLDSLACKKITKEWLQNLTASQLKSLSKKVNRAREKKYKRRHVPKYGCFGFKAMLLEDVDKFFSGFRPEEWRYKVLFLTQAFLGLRVGEVVQIRLKDIDFEHKQILIHSEKKKYDAIDFLYLHEKLEALLLDYISIYEKEITEHQGYLFFSLNSKNSTEFVSTGSARRVFRRVCNRQDLNQTYAERESISGLPFTKGKLYRYSTHSLRHSFAKYLAKRGVPIEIAKHLLRHQDIKTTQIYYMADKEDVDQTMRKLFTQPIKKTF